MSDQKPTTTYCACCGEIRKNATCCTPCTVSGTCVGSPNYCTVDGAFIGNRARYAIHFDAKYRILTGAHRDA